MTSTPEDDLFIRLDRHNLIVEAGGKWDQTARDHAAENLAAEKVVGSSLLDHVSGDATREFVWTMLDMARKITRPITKPYRCDGPDCKRYMEMTITPLSGGDVVVSHRQIKVEPVVRAMPFRSVPSSLLVRCTMCAALKCGQEWLAAEVAIERGHIPVDRTVDVAYSVCPTCRDAARHPPRSTSL